MTDREEYAKKFLKFLRPRQNLALSFTFLKVISDPSDLSLFPSDLNQQLAMTLAKESRQYLKGPALRKILKILEDDGIVLNIRGKKNVKHHVGIKQRKGEDSKRLGGQYSAYKRTPNVQDLLDVLSNPVARQILHDKFKSSNYLGVRVRNYFKLLVENLLYILSKSDERTQTLLQNGFNAAGSLRPNDPNLIQRMHWLVSHLKNVDRKRLEMWSDELANGMMEDKNILKTLYLIFAFAMLNLGPNTNFN
jgi:hypothetical protein